MEDLQGLLEKINREGVEKADAEARRIIAEAEARAKTIVAAAETEAAAKRAAAEQERDSMIARAEATIRQAGRDLVLAVRESLLKLLAGLLTENVEASLADEASLKALAAAAIVDLVGPGEIVAAPKFAAALKAQLAAQKEFTIVTDDALGRGFVVRLDGGRIEQTFTAEVIAAELAQRLRPELAKLLK